MIDHPLTDGSIVEDLRPPDSGLNEYAIGPQRGHVRWAELLNELLAILTARHLAQRARFDWEALTVFFAHVFTFCVKVSRKAHLRGARSA
jgi:hypothetical protein